MNGRMAAVFYGLPDRRESPRSDRKRKLMSETANRSSLLEGIPAESAKKSVNGQSFTERVSSRFIGSIVLAFVSIGALCYVGLSALSAVRNSPTAAANLVTVKDSETGQLLDDYSIAKGENLPYLNPKTGKRTLYPVEACYWTKDGKAKFPPTYVILNERMGKPGPTICPDCGRRVVIYNPTPPNNLMQAAWEESQQK